MDEHAAEAGVVRFVGPHDGVRLVGAGFAEPGLVLGEGLVARARAVDVFPCLRGGEGELVRRDADDGAVGGVEGGEFEVQVAALQGEDVGEAEGGPEFGAREARERVDVRVVDCDGDKVLGSVITMGFDCGAGSSRTPGTSTKHAASRVVVLTSRIGSVGICSMGDEAPTLVWMQRLTAPSSSHDSPGWTDM